MRRILICFLLLTACLEGRAQTCKLVVDAGKKDLLKLSEIADKVLAINYYTFPAWKDYFVRDIIRGGGYYFVRVNSVNGEAALLQFGASGDYIKTVPVKGRGLNHILNNEKEKRLLIYSQGKLFTYDYEGNLKNEPEIGEDIVSPYCYNGLLWGYVAQQNGNTVQCDFIHLDVKTGARKSVGKAGYANISPNPAVSLFCPAFFTVSGGELYMGLGALSSLYKVTATAMKPYLSWEFKNPRMAERDMYFTTAGFLGKYLMIRYRAGRQEKLYVKDRDTAYNVTGIEDDVHKTGEVLPRFTNMERCMYYTDKPETEKFRIYLIMLKGS